MFLSDKFEHIKINYNLINDLRINNLVYFNGIIWKIYDIDNDVYYMSNNNHKNVGVHSSQIYPIVITPDIMQLCGFSIFSNEDSPKYYIGKDNIETKTIYQLTNLEYGIDLKLKVIMNYNFKNDLYELIDIFNKEDEQNLMFIHQIQNIFKDLYKFELIDID